MQGYTHLTPAERSVIAHMRMQGKSIRRIAQELHRAASTISRELRRNRRSNGKYEVERANKKARQRLRHRKRARKLRGHLWRAVQAGLRRKWSPKQISNRLKMEKGLAISHEAIYQRIWREKQAGGTIYRCLRQASKQRRKRRNSYDSRGRLAGKVMIDDRPDVIDKRLELGHWEGDTVLGRGSNHCIVTLVERLSGYVLIGKLRARTVEETNTRISHLLNTRVGLPVASITFDNGTEFHGYKEIEKAFDLPIYFAHPYHSWERGTNENTNGLIRQYLPKGESMATLTQQRCNHIANQLNNRPRERLGYKTPKEYLALFSH